MRYATLVEPQTDSTRHAETVAMFCAIDNATTALRKLHAEARYTAEISLVAPWPTRCAAALERDHYLRMLTDLETRRRKVKW
jgi:hypothetical protein